MLNGSEFTSYFNRLKFFLRLSGLILLLMFFISNHLSISHLELFIDFLIIHFICIKISSWSTLYNDSWLMVIKERKINIISFILFFFWQSNILLWSILLTLYRMFFQSCRKNLYYLCSILEIRDKRSDILSDLSWIHGEFIINFLVYFHVSLRDKEHKIYVKAVILSYVIDRDIWLSFELVAKPSYLYLCMLFQKCFLGDGKKLCIRVLLGQLELMSFLIRDDLSF